MTTTTRGIRASAKRVAAHVSSLTRLQRELARAELGQKGGTLGAGAALTVAAGLLGLYAVGFGLAAVAAALALFVDWWLALAIVFAVLVALVVVLALVSRQLYRESMPLKPVLAMEETRLTRQALRSFGGE